MKTRALLWLAIFGILIWIGCSTTDDNGSVVGPGKSGTQISGELTGILAAAQSPYWITGDISVPTGQTLTIQPGVELRFDGFYQFTVQGHLDAIGTPDENIVFTSMEGAQGNGDFGQWRALVFDTGADSSELAYCLIEFGAVWDSTVRYPVYPPSVDSSGYWLNGVLFCWNSSPIIRNCTIVRNGYHGVFSIGYGSHPRILNNIIVENDGDGIRCELGGSADIQYNNSWKNHARNYAETPAGIGEWTQVNDNRDSTDFRFNFSLDPKFEDIEVQDYDLLSSSPCIGTGMNGLNIGSIPYYVGATELRGPIGSDLTLTAAASPWFVTFDLFLESGNTLTVEPGAKVLFDGIWEVQIAGKLLADGATFMPTDSTNPEAVWLGIVFLNESDEDSYVRNCRFVNTTTSTKEYPFGGVITVQGVSPEISGNTFEGSIYVGISCLNSAQPLISYNTFDGFGTAAIFCYNNSHPNIHHNIIHNGTGYGIWCDFLSSPIIETNVIYATSLVGIKCNQQSAPTIEYNSIVNHDYVGILCANDSDPIIRNSIIAFNGSFQTWQVSSHGNGIKCTNSSYPLVTYNDVYQVPGEGSLFSGIQLDATNIALDPLFVNTAAGDFHLQSNSPCQTAGSDGGEIGAYGKDANW
ncbi:MAG: right-handed parallel beta-helix repeat-containing protein [bacterium]